MADVRVEGGGALAEALGEEGVSEVWGESGLAACKVAAGGGNELVGLAPPGGVFGVEDGPGVFAVRAGDTLVVTKLDRLARSVPDARVIADQLLAREIKLALGPTTYDPNDPMGKMFFNILATFAEFESDLIRMRTREGMAVARAKGKLRGKKPKLSDRQARELRRMYDTGDYSVSDLAEIFSVSRPTVYRTLQRQATAT